MDLKNQIIHHATLIEGERDEVRSSLFEFLGRQIGLKTEGNPDVFEQYFETFKIDDSRMIKEMQSKQSINKKGRFFILFVDFFTVEAQNALLKTFEEPSDGVHFFVIMPNTATLLPTLQSRFAKISLTSNTKKQTENKDINEMVKKFITSKTHERLSIVEPIIFDKNKSNAILFLSAIENIFSERGIKTQTKEWAKFIKQVVVHKKQIHTRGASIKIILEGIALLAPRH